MSVHERLNQILSALPAIGKNQKNPQQGFMFRGHDDILNALNPLLAQHGVIVVPDVLERSVSQRQTSRGGVMYEVSLHVRYTFYGADGDSVTASTWGEGTDMGDKATNKAMTMAFKNVLTQTFAISSAEFVDPDAETQEETKFVAPVSSGGDIAATPPPEEPPGEAERPLPATERPAARETLRILKETVETLQKGFPSPDPTHSYWDDVRAYMIGEFAKANSAELTEAQVQELILHFEKRLVEAGNQAEIPLG